MSQDNLGSSLRHIRNEVSTRGKQFPTQHNDPNSRIENQNQRPSVNARLVSNSYKGRGNHVVILIVNII